MDTATLFKLHRLGLVKRLPGGKWRRRAPTIATPAAAPAVAPAPPPAPPPQASAPTVASAMATYLLRSTISTSSDRVTKSLPRHGTTRSFR